MSSFNRPANYRLIWESYQFSIRESSFSVFASQVAIDGPKMSSPWNLSFTKHTGSWFNGTIFQAAYHYYYGSIKGLKRPPENAWNKPQMKIRVHHRENEENNGTHCKDCRFMGIFAPVRIYNPQNNSSEVYATTIHELAHASHWELRKNDWRETSDKVIESWARGVEAELTRMIYTDYRAIEIRPNYTLVVADMIDADGVNNTNNGIDDDRDKVSGYTIKEIEDVLSYTSSWNNWRDNIKNRYSNPTKVKLDVLFKAYDY